ncbi:hypothetical protein J4N37_08575 [Vibrio sp. SCSIO 43153]|uniref:hypothetical protein n=1 Tax=Vibrio sp. SCSIO 43153 TaxID=2819098 RepID=UPI002075F8C6|nr:hypothetical protein [Vibrio sp. SCSIO 43153]USD48698.1 hypothetical protein J4N37_08575 [Vibrio sp. SCSIO 43153]
MELKKTYKEHMNSEYSAYEYTIILQELSGLLYNVGVGVLSAIVYSKISSEEQPVTKSDIQNLINKYEEKLEYLREHLEDREGSEILMSSEAGQKVPFEFEESTSIDDETLAECEFHERMSKSLKENDPEIIFEIEKALKDLSARSGQS